MIDDGDAKGELFVDGRVGQDVGAFLLHAEKDLVIDLVEIRFCLGRRIAETDDVKWNGGEPFEVGGCVDEFGEQLCLIDVLLD